MKILLTAIPTSFQPNWSTYINRNAYSACGTKLTASFFIGLNNFTSGLGTEPQTHLLRAVKTRSDLSDCGWAVVLMDSSLKYLHFRDLTVMQWTPGVLCMSKQLCVPYDFTRRWQLRCLCHRTGQCDLSSFDVDADCFVHEGIVHWQDCINIIHVMIEQRLQVIFVNVFIWMKSIDFYVSAFLEIKSSFGCRSTLGSLLLSVIQWHSDLFLFSVCNWQSRYCLSCLDTKQNWNLVMLLNVMVADWNYKFDVSVVYSR